MASDRKVADDLEMPSSPERRAESAVFSALGNETRYRILLCLRVSNGQVCVSELESQIDVGQSTISRSLRRLRETGLVSREKRGRRRYYEPTELAERLLAVLEDDGMGAGTADATDR